MDLDSDILRVSPFGWELQQRSRQPCWLSQGTILPGTIKDFAEPPGGVWSCHEHQPFAPPLMTEAPLTRPRVHHRKHHLKLQLSTSYQKSFAMTPHSAIVIKPFNFDRGKIKGGTGRDPGKGKGGGSQGEPGEGQGLADS